MQPIIIEDIEKFRNDLKKLEYLEVEEIGSEFIIRKRTDSWWNRFRGKDWLFQILFDRETGYNVCPESSNLFRLDTLEQIMEVLQTIQENSL